MFLAGILGLCALLHAPVRDASSVGAFLEPDAHAELSADLGPELQETTKPSEPSTPPAPDAQETKPSEPSTPPAPDAQETKPAPPDPSTASKSPAPKKDSPAKPSAAGKKSAKKHKPAPKPAAEHSENPEPRKTVIRKGGTLEPTTQLTPGGTDEQAARQRQTTKELLASTDTALQRLNGRLLTADEQDTVAQIRVYVNQSNAADKAGDLDRAYKLAMKAHLLSDALVKQ